MMNYYLLCSLTLSVNHITCNFWITLYSLHPNQITLAYILYCAICNCPQCWLYSYILSMVAAGVQVCFLAVGVGGVLINSQSLYLTQAFSLQFQQSLCQQLLYVGVPFPILKEPPLETRISQSLSCYQQSHIDCNVTKTCLFFPSCFFPSLRTQAVWHAPFRQMCHLPILEHHPVKQCSFCSPSSFFALAKPNNSTFD